MPRAKIMNIPPDKFPGPALDAAPATEEQTAVLAGGCFWCVDAVYRALEGVKDVAAGYAGGKRETAEYEAVCSGTTGHAEVVRVRFDPKRTTFGEVLRMFFSIAHDPTELNRQGNDIGTQYRSAIFTQNDEQKRVAEAYIAQLEGARVFDTKIVTQVTPLAENGFFEAEDYHQDYANKNPTSGYILHISRPKVEKLRHYFPERLKKD